MKKRGLSFPTIFLSAFAIFAIIMILILFSITSTKKENISENKDNLKITPEKQSDQLEDKEKDLNEDIKVEILSFEWGTEWAWDMHCPAAKDKTEHLSSINQFEYKINYPETSKNLECEMFDENTNKQVGHLEVMNLEILRQVLPDVATSQINSGPISANTLGCVIKICCDVDTTEVCDSIEVPAKCDNEGRVV